MNRLICYNFLLLAVATTGLAGSANLLTDKQLDFLREKLKIELKKHDKFSQELENLSSLEDCRNSINPVDCIKGQESYQNIKNSLSSAITKNLLYSRGRYDANNIQTESSNWIWKNSKNNNRRNDIDRQAEAGESDSLQEFNQQQQALEQTNQAGANETRFIFGADLTEEEFQRQKFLQDFLGPIKESIISIAREIGLVKKSAYQTIEPYLFDQVKYFFDKENQRNVASVAEYSRIIFNGGLTVSLGIRDLFRVLYYFNDWVDDPITFDLFDALFNFGYRQKIPEDGI